jgi:hypothetical protein
MIAVSRSTPFIHHQQQRITAMKTTPISLKPADASDGLYFVYFWVGAITEPAEGWDPVSPLIHVIQNLQKAPNLVANVHVTALKDVSPRGTVKINVLPARTRRADAEKWIDSAEGKAWSKGVVGGSLCAVVLAIPK